MMHSGMLDRRLEADYEYVLEEIGADMEALKNADDDNEAENMCYYSSLTLWYKSKYFRPSIKQGESVRWTLNDETRSHIKEVQEAHKKKKKPTKPTKLSAEMTSDEKILGGLKALNKKVDNIQGSVNSNAAGINSTNDFVIADLQIYSETTTPQKKPNAEQKRILEKQGVFRFRVLTLGFSRRSTACKYHLCVLLCALLYPDGMWINMWDFIARMSMIPKLQDLRS